MQAGRALEAYKAIKNLPVIDVVSKGVSGSKIGFVRLGCAMHSLYKQHSQP